jgi:hypothetical protein
MRRIVMISALVGLTAVLLAGPLLAAPQSFQVRTDKSVYEPGDVIQVNFKYRLEPGMSVLTPNQSELGCHYWIWLEERDGTIVASAGGQACDFSLDCEEQLGPIIRTVDIPLPSDLDCGIYHVRVKTWYLLLSPDRPQGDGLGAETQIPVVVCEDAGCPWGN